ncbi:MAG: hypothetical protein DI537_14080 [Stutzerimonas stutzeri]|nr:MAG: hypothetical protein DI537_14080 [Stutzerimonas stutzeri]
MAKSDTILGLRQSAYVFGRRRSFKVSVYDTRDGRRRFTGPLHTSPRPDPRPSVVYRIKVIPR